MKKKELVAKLLTAKEASGKTYDQIADALGYCNVYVGQNLFLGSMMSFSVKCAIALCVHTIPLLFKSPISTA